MDNWKKIRDDDYLNLSFVKEIYVKKGTSQFYLVYVNTSDHEIELKSFPTKIEASAFLKGLMSK